MSSEIREKVYDFIKNNRNCTKSQVVKGVKDYSRLTILEAIDELMDPEKSNERVKYTRDRPKSFYKLFVNDKNDFARLDGQFKNLEENINKLTGNVVKSLSIMNSKKGKTKTITKMKVLHNLINLAQSVIFIMITRLVSDIEQNIKSNDDREALYHQLRDVLTASGKLNKIIFSEVLGRATHIMQEIQMGGGTLLEKEASIYANIVTSITNIFDDFNQKKSS